MIYGRFEKIIIAGAGYNDSLFYHDSKPNPDPVQLVYAGKLSNAKCAQIDLSTTQDKLDSYTWTGIFKIDKELPLVGSRD